MYRPLPNSLTINQSGIINGLGLFAKEGIAQGTNLGTTHMRMACMNNQEYFTNALREDLLIIPILRTLLK